MHRLSGPAGGPAGGHEGAAGPRGVGEDIGGVRDVRARGEQAPLPRGLPLQPEALLQASSLVPFARAVGVGRGRPSPSRRDPRRETRRAPELEGDRGPRGWGFLAEEGTLRVESTRSFRFSLPASRACPGGSRPIRSPTDGRWFQPEGLRFRRVHAGEAAGGGGGGSEAGAVAGPPPAGHRLKVVQAPEPSDVKWENLDTPVLERRLRRLFTSLVCVVLLVVSFVIIYLAKTQEVGGDIDSPRVHRLVP